jgi:hypothetical protein
MTEIQNPKHKKSPVRRRGLIKQQLSLPAVCLAGQNSESVWRFIQLIIGHVISNIPHTQYETGHVLVRVPSLTPWQPRTKKQLRKVQIWCEIRRFCLRTDALHWRPRYYFHINHLLSTPYLLMKSCLWISRSIKLMPELSSGHLKAANRDKSVSRLKTGCGRTPGNHKKRNFPTHLHTHARERKVNFCLYDIPALKSI